MLLTSQSVKVVNHSLLVGWQVGVCCRSDHVEHKRDTLPVREECVQKALISTIKAATGLRMLEEACIGVLGWHKHKHTGVKAIWPANITHCSQLRVGEELIRILHTL